jgi:hypothetical protein
VNKYRFTVTMAVPPDDQSDPVEVAKIIANILNCKAGVYRDWYAANGAGGDTDPDYRPVFTVDWGVDVGE